MRRIKQIIPQMVHGQFHERKQANDSLCKVNSLYSIRQLPWDVSGAFVYSLSMDDLLTRDWCKFCTVS